MRKLFVSHADADEPVVSLLVELLKHGIGLPPDRIYCTALSDLGRGGEVFVQKIADLLGDPEVVVLALVSPNFMASAFCGNEVGATWITKRELLTYVVPPSNHRILAGVLGERHAPSIGKRTTLDELRVKLTDLLSLPPTLSADWNTAMRRFLTGLGPATFEIERKRAGIRHDVFVSTPMSAVSDDDYVRIRKMALELIGTLETKFLGIIPKFTAYYAARHYATKDAFDKKAKAVEQDLVALRASQQYILILDKDVKTSAHFEAGMALAYAESNAVSFRGSLERRSNYFTRSGVKLPFMMEEIDRKYSSVDIYEYEDEAALASIATRYLSVARWESWGIDKESP